MINVNLITSIYLYDNTEKFLNGDKYIDYIMFKEKVCWINSSFEYYPKYLNFVKILSSLDVSLGCLTYSRMVNFITHYTDEHGCDLSHTDEVSRFKTKNKFDIYKTEFAKTAKLFEEYDFSDCPVF